MRWRRAWQGEGGVVASAGYGKVRKARRKDRRGGDWSGAGKVRYARSSGADEMSSNGLVRVRVKVRVRERMGGDLARQSESEWV